MEEEKTPDVKAPEESAVLKQLTKIEELLTEQVAQNKKAVKSSHVHTAVLVVFVAIIAIGLFVANTTLTKATQELPAMLESITHLTDTATDEIGKLGDLDIASLNDTIKGISTIRFDVLNDSIKALTTIITPLASVIGAIGG